MVGHNAQSGNLNWINCRNVPETRYGAVKYCTVLAIRNPRRDDVTEIYYLIVLSVSVFLGEKNQYCNQSSLILQEQAKLKRVKKVKSYEGP